MMGGVTARNRPEIVYAWRGPSVLVVDNRGRAGGHELSGYYFRETRYLRSLELRVAGDEPYPCSVAQVAPEALEFSAIYPPVESVGGGGSGSGASGERHGLLFRTLDIDLRYRVRPASFELILRVTNRWNERASFDVGWSLDADFAGALEVQAGRREQAAAVEAVAEPDGVRFRYLHERFPLETSVHAEGGGPWHFADGRLSTRLSLGRQEGTEIRLVVRALDSVDPIDAGGEDRREALLDAWRRSVTSLHAPADTPLADITNRAMLDLGSMALLDGDEDGWLTTAAGVPLYAGLFGRDALTAGWQAAVFDRGQLIDATLARLGRLQGAEVNDWRDEQPGRIIQQARQDLGSRLGKTPYDRYYGDHASPLMFIIGLGQMYAWNGDRAAVARHWDAARRVLDWARDHGDEDGDGYLEYRTRSPMGPRHLGWKDSDNAMVHADGSQAEPPIAPCEIQGYHYAALQFMAVLSVVMGAKGDAVALWRQSRELKASFDRDFWLDDEGFVALGLGADKRPIRSLTSNAGQCLTTGIVRDERVPRLVRRLFEPDMFSGWGIRTLSTGNPSYNPISYHLGSIWPVENGTILFGLRRYGFDDRAIELARSLHDLARIWEGDRIPECVGGYARYGAGARAHPGAYPRANVPQAWNQSVFAILVQAILGMRPVAALDLLAIHPVLPRWLPELTVRRLRVGGATVTLRFHRDDSGESHVETVEREGTLHIVRQPPVDSLFVGPWDRLGELVKDVLPL
jgi:glycogen debranching enzyme